MLIWIGACVLHARARALSQGKATYYIPANCLEGLLEQKLACEKLDGSEIPMNIVTCVPGDSISLGKYRMVVFPTQHRVPSQGISIIS